MTHATRISKSQKQVQIIARYEIRRNGHIVYKVLSSNGVDMYTTTLVNGKATGCSCGSYTRCYHKIQLEEKEAARKVDVCQEETAASYRRMMSHDDY